MTDPAEPRPAYAPPAGYAPPSGFAPPYATAGHVTPATATAPAGYPGYPGFGAAPVRRSPVLGRVALVLSLLATVGAGLVAAIAAFDIGRGAGREIAVRPAGAGVDWSILTPVRDWVLLAEVSFWIGSVLGIWALVQGIVAIATRRGRGAGIAALIVAVLGPVVFGIVVQAFVTAGVAAGSGIGG